MHFLNNFKRTTPSGYKQDIRKILDEPTYLGFKLLFGFNDQQSPLLATSDVEHSAYNYLQKNGYTKQLKYLVNFIEELKYVSQQSEWYFQNLDGLNTIWDFNINTEKSRNDKKITIQCLEGLDLRITKILDYYYKACFDTKYRREIVPKNLRYFTMSIYITDMRKYETKVLDVDGNEVSDVTTNMEDSNVRPSIFFKLNMCEIDKLSRASILENVENNFNEQASANIIINHFGSYVEYEDYVLEKEINIQGNTTNGSISAENQNSPQSLLTSSSGDSVNATQAPKFLNNRSNNNTNGVTTNTNNAPFSRNTLQGRLNEIGNNIFNEAANNTNVQRLILGNVYSDGRDIRTLRNLLNQNLSKLL